MPKGDETGSMGFGRMTGRGAGYGFGRGFRHGLGRGRWLRGMYPCAAYPAWTCGWHPAYGGPLYDLYDEKEILSRQAEALEQELELVKKRLSELEEHAAEDKENKDGK
jgi:hypothetical protein